MTSKSSGFSLVAVLIASVLVGFLAVSLSKILTGATSQQKGLERSTEFGSLLSSVNLILSRPDLCSVAFVEASGTPLKWRPSNLSPLQFATANTTANSRLPDPPSGLPIASLNFGAGSKIVDPDMIFAGGLQIDGAGLIPSSIIPDQEDVEVILPGTSTTQNLKRAYADFYIRGRAGSHDPNSTPNRLERRFPLELLFDPVTQEVRYCSTEGISHLFPTKPLEDVVCPPGQYVQGYGPDGLLCGFLKDPSNTVLSFSENPPAGFNPNTCSTSGKNGKMNDFNCQHAKRRCEYRSGSGGTGWHLVNNNNNKIVNSCDGGVAGSTTESSESNIGAKNALPSGINDETHNITCLQPKNEFACQKTLNTNSSNRPTSNKFTQTDGSVVEVESICYRRNGQWEYSKFNSKGKIQQTKACNTGLRALEL